MKHRGVIGLSQALKAGLQGNSNYLREYVQTHHSIQIMTQKYAQLAVKKEYA
ncbi:hypothetical protein JCM19231_1220 [Vibrio ishigakensis]|uniref:Uncharacterized protein n=1 Tax=Vibrio ishigakensis TaxID=1481914 RepID=A0A0B8NX20_9VIBR|nr:hypothetical protein JCM19231_1220 [Vibrio ishigakensis]